MGWNGSGGGSAPVKPKVTAKKPSPVRGIVAGLLVVAVSAVAYFAFFSGSEKPKSVKVEKERGRIKEVFPAKAPTNAAPVKAETAEKTWPPPDAYKDERGIWRYPGGARVFNPKDRERATQIPESSNIPKFTHAVEREIATLLTMEPGGMLVGEPPYHLYAQDFQNAILDKIEINEDDSERDKAIKQAVIDAKKELCQRIKEGEDVVQILKESREEIRRLNAYKRELENLVREQVRNAELSDEDVADSFAAANKLLEEKGIAPMRSNAIMKRRQDILLQEARRAERAAANSQSIPKEETQK